MKQQILKDIGGDLLLQHFVNGLQVVPTNPKITIYDSSGNEKVAQTSASVDADGNMTYNIIPALADDVYYNWRADWEFTVGSDTLYRSQLFDIVLQILSNPIIDDDIIKRYPFVKDQNYRRTLTADSGTVNTIVSAELNEKDDYWTAGTVEIISGTNEGEKRDVISFDNTTNKITVASDFSSAIDSTSKFTVIRSFQREISEAFDIFNVDLVNKGVKPQRIIDQSQTREYILLKTIHLICQNYTVSPGDIWFEKSIMYGDEYKDKMKIAVFDYDDNDSGNISDDEAGRSVNQTKGAR